MVIMLTLTVSIEDYYGQDAWDDVTMLRAARNGSGRRQMDGGELNVCQVLMRRALP